MSEVKGLFEDKNVLVTKSDDIFVYCDKYTTDNESEVPVYLIYRTKEDDIIPSDMSSTCIRHYTEVRGLASNEEINKLINKLKSLSNSESRKYLKRIFNIDCPIIVNTYNDLIEASYEISGCSIDKDSNIRYRVSETFNRSNRAISKNGIVAKSMRAMAMISQLMPYYGGEVTRDEWNDTSIPKYVIFRHANSISFGVNDLEYEFLAFHTKEQRSRFLNFNEKLVKEYLMIKI